ncbi:HEAT repeat domain-containing protein [Chloroflexota bacterium]
MKIKIPYRKNKEDKMCSKRTKGKKIMTERDRLDYFIEGLNHESPLCRSVAIVELREAAGEFNLLPYIIPALNDTDGMVRSAAVRSLGGLTNLLCKSINMVTKRECKK